MSEGHTEPAANPRSLPVPAPPLGEQRGEEDPDRTQIVERLNWTPKQRLAYLVDMVTFEERVRLAKRLG